MYCKKCGAEIADDAEFCSKCGEQQRDVCEPVRTKDKVPGAVSILVLGILSLVLPLVYSVPAAGLICGLICRARVKEYAEAGGEITEKASIGKNLGQAGLIISIVALALSVLAIIIFILIYTGMIAILFGFLRNIPDVVSYAH